MKKKIKVKKSDLYETPLDEFKKIEKLFGKFDLDVCAQKTTAKCKKYFSLERKQNAFHKNWSKYGKRAFMNPPYSNVRPWLEKAIKETKRGIVVVALLPSSVDAIWYHELIRLNPKCIHHLLPGRIKFLYNKEIRTQPRGGNMYALFWG